jgi:hypothetical protein
LLFAVKSRSFSRWGSFWMTGFGFAGIDYYCRPDLAFPVLSSRLSFTGMSTIVIQRRYDEGSLCFVVRC